MLQMAQELGVIEKSPDFVNPYKKKDPQMVSWLFIDETTARKINSIITWLLMKHFLQSYLFDF